MERKHNTASTKNYIRIKELHDSECSQISKGLDIFKKRPKNDQCCGQKGTPKLIFLAKNRTLRDDLKILILTSLYNNWKYLLRVKNVKQKIEGQKNAKSKFLNLP